jgi:hypothetical protein
VETNPATLAQQAQQKHFFGKLSGAPQGGASQASKMVLVGIIFSDSSRQGVGVALISVDGNKAVTASVGEDVAPGLRLTRVAADHVEVVRDGQPINLELSAKK